MRTVLAAIDDSAAARPVLVTAQAIAAPWCARVSALHISDDGGGTASGVAHVTGVPLRLMSGDAVTCVLQAAASADVVAVVVGARGRPRGPRPAGHVTMEILSRCHKPIVVVPPEIAPHREIRRMVIALEGTINTSDVLQRALELGRSGNIHVVAAHVDDERSMPSFSDQPQHETEAFAAEFLARYARAPDGALPWLELRIGDPAAEVLDLCAETDADLLTLAWSGRLEPDHALFVRHILERARVPILLLPVTKDPGASHEDETQHGR